MNSLSGLCRLILLFALISASTASAQEIAMLPGPSQQVGKYRVSIRLPEDGLSAGEEQQIEFRLVDTSRDDPVLGPAAVIRATIVSTISMPTMASMPKVEEIPHPEGIPGDYGLHPTFAHGGDFVLALRITPPRDEPFTVEFPLKVGDERVSHGSRPKPYQVQLGTEPGKVKAGELVRLRISVLSNLESRDGAGRPSGKRQLLPVRTFDTMHERQMHLIIVRRDLSFFTHQHPEIQADGSFILDRFTFPTPGEYQLFFDTAPKGAGGQVLLASLKVEGKSDGKAAAVSPGQSALGVVAQRSVGGVIVSLKDPNGLLPRKTMPFAIGLESEATKEPIVDLQPYLGALGHMILIHEDAQTFVHSHPDERDPENGKHGILSFLSRPPKPGTYRLWIEFKRDGKVNVAEFIVEVKDGGQKN
ncbi:MAG: hypothetical protein ABI882_07190 [Acidobacteriota bacterium]